MDLGSVLQSILPGLLAGGGAAGTSFLTVFKNALKKLSELEKKIGEEDSDPPTGIYYVLETLRKSHRDLKNEIQSWRDEPPDWLVRIIQRSSRNSSINGESMFELEQRVNTLRLALARLEETLEQYVPRSEYEEDSRQRSQDIGRIQENLRSANSFLKGVLAALGYIDQTPSNVVEEYTPPSPPPLPPAKPRLNIPTGKPFPVQKK